MPINKVKTPLPSGSGQFAAVTHDAQLDQTVWTDPSMSVAASLTASITAGRPISRSSSSTPATLPGLRW